ncbi:hypothetical protein S245_060519, partial [Arachis hypogaea]
TFHPTCKQNSINCSVGVVRSHTKGPRIYSIGIPPSNIGEQFGQLLKSGRGTDVSFEVNGEIFAAHKLALAARSPVFRAQICGPVKDQNVDCINTGYNFSISRAASLFSAESSLSQVYCILRKPQSCVAAVESGPAAVPTPTAPVPSQLVYCRVASPLFHGRCLFHFCRLCPTAPSPSSRFEFWPASEFEFRLTYGLLHYYKEFIDDIDEELLQEVVNMGFDRNQLVESLCNRIQNEMGLLPEPTEQDLRQMKNQKSPKYDLP